MMGSIYMERGCARARERVKFPYATRVAAVCRYRGWDGYGAVVMMFICFRANRAIITDASSGGYCIVNTVINYASG